MRFELPADIFANDAAPLDHLDRLLERVIDEVHHLIVRNADALEGTAWFQGLRPHRKELVRSAIHAAAFVTHGHQVKVGSDVSLPMAARLAYMSLKVLVEDEGSDGRLVSVAIAAYGNPETRRLWQHKPRRAMPSPCFMEEAAASNGNSNVFSRKRAATSYRRDLS